MLNQENAILHHLQNIGPITPIEALNLYGCFRLGARVYDLKQNGYDIETRIIHHNEKHFASYSLTKNEPILKLIPVGKQAQVAFA